MSVQIPYDTWQPLTLPEVCNLFENAPFKWALAGGYAIELFLGQSIRSHGDTDIIIYRDEQLLAQDWLKDWQLYAADPPGTLRLWEQGEFLPSGINDIWVHHKSIDKWQFQFMLTNVDGVDWVSKRNPLIRGKRDTLITIYDDMPCIKVEIQLLYKAKRQRPKDEQDFHACVPLLDSDSKKWLKDKLIFLYPAGHDWLAFL